MCSIVLIVFFVVGNAIADLNDGLVAYYPFNENANDESGNGNSGTVNGATLAVDRFGNKNSSYKFDGVDDYIVISDGQDLRLANSDFTLSVWIYETERNESFHNAILTKRGIGSKNGWFYSVVGLQSTNLNITEGKLFYNVSGGGDANSISSKILDLKNYHHVVIIYNYDELTLRMFIDAELDSVATNIPSPSSTTSSDLYIGKDSADAVDGYYFHGIIDDIRIYNRTLTESEILQLFHMSHCDAQYQLGFEAGKQFCINNLADCGITIGLYTEEDMQNMVNNLLQWDINKDNQIGLVEAVKILRDKAGIIKSPQD